MRIVSPYRAFAPEVHGDMDEIAQFDWIDALRMLNHSAEQSCRFGIEVLTDDATAVPLPAIRLKTDATRLQEWLVEIRLAFLESPAFDQDTVLVSPDTLIMAGLGRVFERNVDLALLVRPQAKFQGQWKSILNSVQWWRHAAKDRLIAFYREAVAISRTLPEGYQAWGGDTEALRQLLEPIEVGIGRRGDLMVEMLSHKGMFRSLSTEQIAALEGGEPMPRPTVPLFDFKYRRKRYMRQAFEALFVPAVAR